MSTSVNTTILFIVTIIMWIVLSFTQQRTKKGLERCGGRPGIVFPVNFLNPRHRLVYVLACGALASEWFGLLTTTMSLNINKWATPIVHPFVIMYMVSKVIIITYPILACVEAPIPLVGYIMGAIYCDIYLPLSITAFAINLKSVSTLLSSSLKDVYYSNIVVSSVPRIICLIGILIWYHYKLIKELLKLYKRKLKSAAIQGQPPSMNHTKYVKKLLQPPETQTFFKKYIITRTKLPFPVLIVAIVVAIIIFQLTVFVSCFIPYLFELLAELFDQLSSDEDNSFFNKFPVVFRGLTALSVISPILASVFCCILFIHFIHSLRISIKELQSVRGGVFKSISSIDQPVTTLSSSVRYAGYQVAAFITAWILYTVVIFVIGLTLMALIGFPSVVGYYFYKLVIIVVWLLVIIYIERLICKLFFVSNDSADLKTVIIDNRRAFNMFSYIVLLYNMATGLMTAIKRVGLSFLFMIMILPRMDRPMFVKGFEKCDKSHIMFKSFMLMEGLLHNSIVHVFVKILLERKNNVPVHYTKSVNSFYEDSSIFDCSFSYGISPSSKERSSKISILEKHRVSQKAYNRWFVAYTLIKNPQLAKTFQYNESSPLLKEVDDS